MIGDHLVVYKRCGCVEAAGGRQLGRRCARLGEDGHGRWYVAVQVSGLSGRRERIRRGGFSTPEEARQAGEELIAADCGGRPGGMCTVGQWLVHWQEGLRGLRLSTWTAYDSHIRLYLIPQLGRIRLAALTSRQVEQMFTALAMRRNRHGRPLAAGTLERVRATLRVALNAAVRDGLLAANPACGLRLPGPRRPHPVVWTERRVAAWRRTGERPAVAIWTVAQLVEFLDFVAEDRLFALWWLIALRGLRRGEAAGLRWVDLDLEAGELAVCRQLVQIVGKVIECPPKSTASHRTVALDAETVRVLRDHERAQQIERLECGPAWVESGQVFTMSDGRPVQPGYLTHRFGALVASSGLPPVRLHDLRHGAACLALAAHADLKVVQGQLGHSSIVLTADTYVSVLPELYHEAAAATARLVLETARSHARAIRYPAA